ncbi:MAG: hypothetical protein ACK5Y2_04775 [Bdellovibrionales bacterium]
MIKQGRQASIATGIALFILALGTFLFWDRIPAYDSTRYLHFADQRTLLGIPHALDVLSNLSFLWVGVWGLNQYLKSERASRDLIFKAVLSGALILTAFGSAYFHWEPTPDRLFWDRLPMSLAFAAIIGWIVSDKSNFAFGACCAVLCALVGAITLTLWKLGLGHLKLYYVLQFGGLLLGLGLCLFVPGRRFSNQAFLLGFALYVVAKILEERDTSIFVATELVSGHTLKHLVAAAAVFVFLRGRSHDYFASPKIGS